MEGNVWTALLEHFYCTEFHRTCQVHLYFICRVSVKVLAGKTPNVLGQVGEDSATRIRMNHVLFTQYGRRSNNFLWAR